MWIFPKNFKSQNTIYEPKPSLHTIAETFSRGVLFRGNPAQSTIWVKRFRAYPIFQMLMERSIPQSLDIDTRTALLKGYLNRKKPLVSTQSTDWADLPLFCVEQDASYFCSIARTHWEAWVSLRKRMYLDRTRVLISETDRWATPTAMDSLAKPRSVESLMRQAMGLRRGRATPCTLREQVDPLSLKTYRLVSEFFKEYPSRTALTIDELNDFEQVQSKSTEKELTQHNIGLLNPRWVECLMGLPLGWTKP
jgi:hypothetical protein